MSNFFNKKNKQLKTCKIKQYFYIITIILLNIFLILYVAKTSNIDRFYNYFSTYKNATFCYVTRLTEETFSPKVVRVSNCQFVYFDTQKKSVKLSDVFYKQMTIDSDSLDNKKVFQDLRIHIIKCENVNGIDIIYGYSPSFSEAVSVGGQKINFQFALSNNKVTIGCPIIFGSY